jgi:hypothetical protein
MSKGIIQFQISFKNHDIKNKQAEAEALAEVVKTLRTLQSFNFEAICATSALYSLHYIYFEKETKDV